jgi:hypothetical protein
MRLLQTIYVDGLYLSVLAFEQLSLFDALSFWRLEVFKNLLELAAFGKRSKLGILLFAHVAPAGFEVTVS